MSCSWHSLAREVERWHRHVQILKGSIRSHTASFHELADQGDALNAEVASAETDLREAAGSFAKLGPTLVPALLEAVPVEEKARVGGVLAKPEAGLTVTGAASEEVPQMLDLAPPRLRPAPQRRAP